MSKALILVDIQNDFMPGGPLAVPEGDQVVPVANRLIQSDDDQVIAATQDWHPADHGSFASQHPGKNPGDVIDLHGLQQTLWPDHCIQGTPGAEFHPDLDTGRIDHVFVKGADRDVDSYSGFFDNGKRHDTGLHDYLQRRGVNEVHIVGLATDVCVKATALHAAELGYDTIVHHAGIRAVNLQPGDGEKSIQEMRDAGVRFI
jgi:nicotinamidase/pyrazinamidase